MFNFYDPIKFLKDVTVTTVYGVLKIKVTKLVKYYRLSIKLKKKIQFEKLN